MSRLEQIKQLNRMLLAELPQYREQAEAFPPDETSQRRLLRSLMNVRPPVPASAEFLAVQDAYLRERLAERGVTRLTDLTPMRPATAASTTRSTPTRGCSCGWSAPRSCGGRATRKKLAGQRSQKPIICPAAMCCTPSARSSVAASPGQTGNSWQTATAPAWSWRRNGASTAWPFAASPPANSISRTNGPRGSPFGRSEAGSGKIQTRSR